MRISDEYLKCAAFIYPNKAAALTGKWAGGSGCLVRYGWVEGGEYKTEVFIVTNRHVIDKLDEAVVRINLVEGDFDIFPIPRESWHHPPSGDDIACARFDAYDRSKHLAEPFNESAFLTKHLIPEHNIGIGDRVVMIGRLVEHDGKVRNLPAARFGAIAMLDEQTLKNDFGHEQETFLIDCPSLAGFSGSPVIVYLPGQARGKTALLYQGLGPWLLGIDWMHVSEPVTLRETGSGAKVSVYYVEGNSGVAGVIPAWLISALLRTMVPWDPEPVV